ncbi:MAG TPA: universal stress protein [Pyrinomonadaceae bacterium]|jgi:nucleotide-binding universal stress UspA family protein|nr:universal stress protein [Pyrinomonadaceae bacterium]
MFRNILFPTDFTPHARSALKYAAAFARAGGRRVVLFSVQTGQVPANLMTLPERILQNQEKNWLLQLRGQVNELLTDPLFAGLEVDPVIVEGEPADEIAKAIREYDIDLVTVVTHGRRGLARALFGSTAEEIIAEAPCPVLTIRPPQHDFVQHRGSVTEIRLNRILLATNFRPSSIVATNVARQMAENSGAELHAIYVIGDYFEQISVMFPEGGRSALSRMRQDVQSRMQSFAGEGNGHVKTHVAEGRPYAEIVRLAAEIDADLIVIGTTVHASLFGGAPALGSEIERVVRNAPCPVLCVPSGKVVTPLPAFGRTTQPLPQT